MKNTTLKEFRANTERVLDLLSEAKATALLDEAGDTTAYLVDRDAYETMQRRMRLLEGIARGEKAFQEGRFVTHAEAKKKLRRWLKK